LNPGPQESRKINRQEPDKNKMLQDPKKGRYKKGGDTAVCLRLGVLKNGDFKML